MKKTIKLAALAAAAMSMSAIGGVANAQASSPSDYVMQAGASDQYEIQSSKLVMKSSADPHVKRFANQMVTDHTKSTGMVKAAAMKDGLNPAPPALDADGQQMMSALMAAQGPARDTLYWQQQKTAHAKALALQKDYSMNGTGALKGVATNIVPVVQQHETMLQMDAPSGM